VVIANVTNIRSRDFEVDLEFKVVQSGEETQFKMLTVIIEANRERMFFCLFSINSDKEAETIVKIVAQRPRNFGDQWVRDEKLFLNLYWN